MAYSVVLEGGSPWGFRLQGGVDFNEPLRIAKINQNSKASIKCIRVGDFLDGINNTQTKGLKHHEALQLIKNAQHTLALDLCRSDGKFSKSDTYINREAEQNKENASVSEGNMKTVYKEDTRDKLNPLIMNNNEDKSADLKINSEHNLAVDLSPESSKKSEIVPVWSPSGSTNTIKKEFKSVKLDTTGKKAGTEKPKKSVELSPGHTFAWKSSEAISQPSVPACSGASSTAEVSTISTISSSQTISNSTGALPMSPAATWNGNIRSMEDSRSGLPKPQSPTITLLQKGREGQLPRGAVYVGTKETVDEDVKHTDTYYLVPSEEKTTTVTKTVKKAPKYEGTGPVTVEGMPTGLKTTIDEKHQKDWYKKMYKSIHKTEKGKEENTYKPTYVFPSDSESDKDDERPWTNLDKIDPSVDDKKFSYEGYGKGPMSYAHARSRLEVYKNQPRSITDYEPGFSSIAFKESKTEDGITESKGVLFNPPIEKPGQFSKYTVKTHVSEPDIRKSRELRSLSPTDSHEAYKIIQKGGEIPLSGLRLPAPEKTDFTWACMLSSSWLLSTFTKQHTNSLISYPCNDNPHLSP